MQGKTRTSEKGGNSSTAPCNVTRETQPKDANW